MKSTGIIRNIDELGRIVVPKEIRKQLDINNNDPVEIYVDGDKIILKKHLPACYFCGNTAYLNDFKGKKICNDCIEEIKLG